VFLLYRASGQARGCGLYFASIVLRQLFDLLDSSFVKNP
jgi:hypothetical protein